MSKTVYQIPEAVSGQHFGNLRAGPFELAAGEHVPGNEGERELLEHLVAIGLAHVAPAAAKSPRKEA